MSRQVVTALLVIASGAILLLAIVRPLRNGHPVTPTMESAAEGVAGRSVTTLSVDNDRMMVVVFVLPDCPCSIDYETYVQRLHQTYGDQIAFLEVVAGDGLVTEQWKQQQSTPFPVISDWDKAIAQEFGASRSAYTALVREGKIIKLWPGYSVNMLQELGKLISEETKSASRSFDVSGAPEQMTSGCSL
jgi:peroxiredoxin